MHGQSATTIWVWERTFDPKSDFAGSIMHRPACAEAVGVVNHDLNRAALEITAIQQARPQAVLLQSVTASVWDGGRYSDCLGKLYTALSFTGLKMGFVTERQLEDGLVPARPSCSFRTSRIFPRPALTGLRKYQGRIVFVGDNDLLTHDEYGRTRTVDLPAERITFHNGAATAQDLRSQILSKLPAWNMRPTLELRGPDQRPVWGVEWRSAKMDQSTIVNLCNYRNEPVTVSVVDSGKLASARDVLTGENVNGPLTLAPLEVRLLRFE